MGIINGENVTKTYEIKKKQLAELIAADLKVPVNEITIEFVQCDVSNDRFERNPRYEVTAIKVIHKPTGISC
ncbi:MAG: hypothetical protein WC979_02450 [Candidatus Pacearchaeota archaeon]|jgi:hypothetical protein|nr:hypothetical protein [Clostridia bacterium]